MASFDFDQAEGLRRMLAGPKPRIVTFVCTMPADEKAAMLFNLGASLTGAGCDVVLLDACAPGRGISSQLSAPAAPTLLQAARQECAMERVVAPLPQGFGMATLARGVGRAASLTSEQEARQLAHVFELLVSQAGMVVVDAELADDDSLPLAALGGSEIVVQVSTSAASIKSAYTLIKRLNGRLGRRPFSLLVTGASDAEAKVVYDNMAKAASRYLAVQLTNMGSVPADEHLKRAAHLGRAVVDAYPLAGASVAFRRLAGRFAISGAPVSGMRRPATGANFGL